MALRLIRAEVPKKMILLQGNRQGKVVHFKVKVEHRPNLIEEKGIHPKP
jgi:hypothetical protein